MPKIIYICSMRIFLFLLFVSLFNAILGQPIPTDSTQANSKVIKSRAMDADSSSIKFFNPTINDYLFWTESHPKKPFDTALSLHNQYRYTQFNNQDNLKKSLFNNIGQPLNTLVWNNENNRINLLPNGKRQIYLSANEIRYYDVKTPTTEFIYHNGMKEGQALSTLFTYSINSQINFGIEYKGVRSLGHYLESEIDSRTFITTFNYHTKNKKYQLWAHYYNLNNGAVENAGIKNREDFTSGDPNFRNRQRLLVNLNGARSKYLNRRYYLGQSYNFLKAANDSIQGKSFLLKNLFSYESNDFRYFENADNDFYTSLSAYIPDVYKSTDKYNKILTDVATLSFNAADKYEIEAGVKFQNIKYYFGNQAIIDQQGLPNDFSDGRIGFVGNMKADVSEKLNFDAQAEFMSGNYFGTTYDINASLKVRPINQLLLFGSIGNSSLPPPLNLIYNNSFYENFNYYLSDFKNQNQTEFSAGIELLKYKTQAAIHGFNIENYTYLNYDGAAVQSSASTQIFQIQLQNQLDYKKFHCNTNLIFQSVSSNQDALPLPNFVGRINIYYKSMMFKNAANVQIGLKTKYFTSYRSPEYFPVMNEFKLQDPNNEMKIGNYPIMDFYLDMRVKSMQIYLEAQHFNSFFTGYNYFSTPNIPLYDFRINISLIWYLFT